MLQTQFLTISETKFDCSNYSAALLQLPPLVASLLAICASFTPFLSYKFNSYRFAIHFPKDSYVSSTILWTEIQTFRLYSGINYTLTNNFFSFRLSPPVKNSFHWVDSESDFVFQNRRKIIFAFPSYFGIIFYKIDAFGPKTLQRRCSPFSTPIHRDLRNNFSLHLSRSRSMKIYPQRGIF